MTLPVSSPDSKSLDAYKAISMLFAIIASIALLANVIWPGSIPTIILNGVALSVIAVSLALRQAFLSKARQNNAPSASSPTS